MSLKFLKVKIKSLAAESRIIHKEEAIAHLSASRGSVAAEILREDLHLHRVRDVRNECRTALVAYAYLRERPLAAVETWNARPLDIKRLTEIVARFGPEKDKLKVGITLDAWITHTRAAPLPAAPETP